MNCKECGAEILEGTAFCRYCGAKVEPILGAEYCSGCGYPLMPGVKFCPRCGKRADDECSESNNYDKIDIDSYEETNPKKKLLLFDKVSSFWSRLDRVARGCIIIGGFFLYLFILSCVAHKGFGTTVCVLQFILLGTFLADHYKKISTRKDIRTLIIGTMILLSVVYLSCFHATIPEKSGDNTAASEAAAQSKANSDELFYTTNTEDTYKNGNSGVYSYAAKTEGGYLYFIFDIDSKHIYSFLYGSQDKGWCLKYEMQPGDLNSGIAFTINSSETYTEAVARFAEKDMPQQLVIQGSSSESATLYATNLSNALHMKDQKSIIAVDEIQGNVPNTADETTESEVLADDKVKVDFSSYSLIGESFEAVGAKLARDGFTNISYEIVYDIIWGITEEGSVKSVTIAGLKNYSKGDVFQKDDPIVVTYHMMQKDDPKRPTDGSTPAVQQATENKSVSYSTNTTDTYKNGKSGVYAYKSYGNRYDTYWIIDFDEGYIYSFSEGLGDDSCAKLAIESGDLNSSLTFSFHEDGKAYQWCAHFKWKNQPDHLVIVDDDNFDYDYYSTNLSDALRIRNQKDIALH